MGKIAENLAEIRAKIADAASRSGRKPTDVKLVAVTKTLPVGDIIEAYEAGQRAFGENYAQEFRDKVGLAPSDIEWHFIGALQKNKVKYIVDKVAMIHSIDSTGVAAEINKRSGGKVGALIEVNIAGERAKSGVAVKEIERLIDDIRSLSKIEVRGLMAMPPFDNNPESSRPHFVRLRELRDKLRKTTGLSLDELSMGMSGDYEVAVAEGATIVRVGTAIFGERKNN